MSQHLSVALDMAERKAIIPPGVSPNPALSPGIQVGDTLYVSGHVAVDASGNVVGEGDCEVQTRQVMANIRAVVKAVGGSMENVVKITCFLTDVANYPAYSKSAGGDIPQQSARQFHRHRGWVGAAGAASGGGSSGPPALIGSSTRSIGTTLMSRVRPRK